MAPAIKIIDKRPNEPHRHNKVFQTFGRIGVSIKKVHDGKGVFFAIANEDSLETILSSESTAIFREVGFELVPPIEYNSLKTVVIKNLDYMVDSYSDEEIIESIERLNSWAKVEYVYKIPTTSKLIKVRFQNQQMVQVALQKGINILHQHIPQWSIEKELFVRLTPCRNCYGYDHRLKDCKAEKKARCTYCAEEHKQSECKANQPCCINCGGQHRTLAAACKIRKELIKQKSGDIRANARSQSQHRQYTSYASAATSSNNTGSQKTSNSVPGLTKNETKEIITTIMSSIVFSHYVEAIEPGSFQRTMNEMFKKNGLKPVNFPTPPMNDVILQSCREVFTCSNETETETETDNTDPTAENVDKTSRPDDITSMTKDETQVQQMLKRQRESMTPPNRNEKRLKDDTPKQTTGQREQTRETVRQTKKGGARSRSNSSQSTASTSTMSSNVDNKWTNKLRLTIYVKNSSNLNFSSNDLRDKEEIRQAVLDEKEAKFTWENLQVEREGIIKAMRQGRVDFDTVKYERINDAKFDKLISANKVYGHES